MSQQLGPIHCSFVRSSKNLLNIAGLFRNEAALKVTLSVCLYICLLVGRLVGLWGTQVRIYIYEICMSDILRKYRIV